MGTKKMNVYPDAPNRMYSEDIKNGVNQYTEILKLGLGVTSSSPNSILFKLVGLTFVDTDITFDKNSFLIIYNNTGQDLPYLENGEAALCKYTGTMDYTITVAQSLNLYVGYNVETRIADDYNEYNAYYEFYFQLSSFQGSVQTINVPSVSNVNTFIRNYIWLPLNYHSVGVNELNTPFNPTSIFQNNTITGSLLQDNTITGSKLADDSVGEDQLVVSDVYGLFYDYTISPTVGFSALSNILNSGSKKIRVLAGNYTLTSTINLGNTSSSNKVEIFCDPGVVINGVFTNTVSSIFSVNDDSGMGTAYWNGGTFKAQFNGTADQYTACSILNGFTSVSEVNLVSPTNSTAYNCNMYLLNNCNNIYNCRVTLNNTSYTNSQSDINMINGIFYNCKNIDKIYINTPYASTGTAPYVRVFDTCSDISNIRLYIYPTNKNITYFYNSSNITNVNCQFSGDFSGTSSDTGEYMLAYLCQGLSQFNIKGDVQSPTSQSSSTKLSLIDDCSNIQNLYMVFSTTSSSYTNLYPSVNAITDCFFVRGCYINCYGNSNNVAASLFGVIDNSKMVTNNYVYSGTQLIESVYNNSYADNGLVPCSETSSGGFNIIDAL